MIRVQCIVTFVVLVAVFGCAPGQSDQNRQIGEETAAVANDSQPAGRGPGRAAGRRSGPREGGQGGRGQAERVQEIMARLQPVTLTAEESEAVDLETVVAELRPLEAKLHAIGTVVAPPRTKALVSYAFPARIAEVHVRLGDWVEQGQRLITLQSEEVGNARAEYYKAMADHQLAQANYERQTRLMERGVGARKDAIAAESELTVARSNLEAAEKNLHMLGFTEAQVLEMAETHQVNPSISLYAPISGKIVENNAVMGARVDQSTEILTIMDSHLLRVDVEIYEKDIAKIRLGQRVEARVPAYVDETFVGRIQYISDFFKEDTRTITVHTEVANMDYKLKPGMFADIDILLNGQQRVLTVPQAAILDDGPVSLVFVESDGEYLPFVVETGIEEGGFVQILSGINAGDVIVTSGNFQLKSIMYEDVLAGGHAH
jgi:cobalt-zinc-cadmium efflux system membrane fusion protein